MNAFKYSAVALAMAASFSTSAMTSIADADLAQVSGQEGVSIIADLNINIGAFTYTDDGASVSFNNIGVQGMMVATIDVLTAGTFVPAAIGAVVAQSAGGVTGSEAAALVTAVGVVTGWTGQDVVQFAFPATFGAASPTITVSSITTGHGGASMGGIQIKKIDLAGTRVWMYGHN